jgi:hypothetical protein
MAALGDHSTPARARFEPAPGGKRTRGGNGTWTANWRLPHSAQGWVSPTAATPTRASAAGPAARQAGAGAGHVHARHGQALARSAAARPGPAAGRAHPPSARPSGRRRPGAARPGRSRAHGGPSRLHRSAFRGLLRDPQRTNPGARGARGNQPGAVGARRGRRGQQPGGLRVGGRHPGPARPPAPRKIDRFEVMQEHWSPTAQAATILAGGSLVLWGTSHGTASPGRPSRRERPCCPARCDRPAGKRAAWLRGAGHHGPERHHRGGARRDGLRLLARLRGLPEVHASRARGAAERDHVPLGRGRARGHAGPFRGRDHEHGAVRAHRLARRAGFAGRPLGRWCASTTLAAAGRVST